MSTSSSPGMDKELQLFGSSTSSTKCAPSRNLSITSLKSFRNAVDCLGIFRSRKSVKDLESQTGHTGSGDDGSLFQAEGPDGTKVRKREFTHHRYRSNNTKL